MNKYSDETWNVMETFLHTCYYYGLTARVGLGIVILARSANVSAIEMLSRYLHEDIIKAHCDEVLRTRP